MRQHDALGKSGCARGINQRGDAVGNFAFDWFRLYLFIEWSDCDWADRSSFLNSRTVPLRVFSRLHGNASRIDDAPGTTMLADLINFSRRLTCIDQNGPCIDPSQPQKNSDERTAVFANHHDSVARPHTQIEKPFLYIRNRRCEFPASPGSRCFDQSGTIRRNLGPSFDYVTSALGKIGQELSPAIHNDQAVETNFSHNYFQIITGRLFKPLNPNVDAHSGRGPTSFIFGKRCTRF